MHVIGAQQLAEGGKEIVGGIDSQRAAAKPRGRAVAVPSLPLDHDRGRARMRGAVGLGALAVAVLAGEDVADRLEPGARRAPPGPCAGRYGLGG